MRLLSALMVCANAAGGAAFAEVYPPFGAEVLPATHIYDSRLTQTAPTFRPFPGANGSWADKEATLLPPKR